MGQQYHIDHKGVQNSSIEWEGVHTLDFRSGPLDPTLVIELLI